MSNRFSCRTSAFVGGLLLAVGFMLSFFANSVYFLIGTIGVCAGMFMELIAEAYNNSKMLVFEYRLVGLNLLIYHIFSIFAI